jgi:hypothetical protein
MRRHSRKIAIGAAAVVAAAGGGGAIAATKLDPRQESEAVVEDAAEQLGVEPSELEDALEDALANRVDQAVEAGRLTEEQGAELKERIRSGEVPLMGLGGPRHAFGGALHRLPELDAAASYLGMTEPRLASALEDGKTMAELAEDRGKSVDGLVDALVEAAEKDLAAAVEAGRLTDAQRDSIRSGLEQRIRSLVKGEAPPLGRLRIGPPPWHGDRDGPPEPDLGSVA